MEIELTVITRPKVVVSGWYGVTNVGDELLLDTVLGWVRESGGEAVVISVNPSHTAREYNCDAVDFHNIGAIAKVMAECDIFVMGGGGIFQDHHPFTLEALYDPVAPDIAQYARHFYLARQFGLKTVICAHGVGPITTHQAKQIVRDIFDCADYVSLRDDESSSVLRKLGVERELIVAADPGWLLHGTARVSETRIHSEVLNQVKKRLGLIIREWPTESRWHDRLISALESELNDTWECVWIGFQTALNEDYAVSDRPFLEEMSYRLGPAFAQQVITPASTSEAMEEIGKCQALVSMRLHGGIMALASEVPSLFLEYDRKVAAANDAAGVPAHLRLSLDDDVHRYVEALKGLLNPNEEKWLPEPNRIELLKTSALVHSDQIRAVMGGIDAERSPRRWSSLDYDWLGGWVQTLIWRERDAQARSDYAHSILHSRDSQLTELQARLDELEMKNQKLREIIAVDGISGET